MDFASEKVNSIYFAKTQVLFPVRSIVPTYLQRITSLEKDECVTLLIILAYLI